jgi:DNA replication and repair protein RecF
LGGLVIETLALSHFRSHRATRLSLDGRPVALIGPNGAGKTNVLEAISLLSPGRGLRRASAEDLARRPEALGWKVSAAIDGLSGRHEVETWAEPGEPRQLRIDGKSATQASLGRVLRMLWIVPAMDRLWIEAAEGRRRFLDRLTLSFAPEHAEHSLAYDKAMRDRNRLIRDQVTDAHWYTALETRMAETGQQITRNRRAAIARISSAFDFASAFPMANLTLTGPEGAEEPDDLFAALAEGRRRDMAAGRTLVGPHRADLSARYVAKDMAADQCSTGEQKALLISLILANARALSEDLGRAPVLLLDEVAAHLDETRRAALFDEICTLGAQAVMTGTDAALFEALGPRGQVLSVQDDGAGSRVGVE